MYTYTDKALALVKKMLLREFRKLRILKFDELNTLNSVVSVYKRIDKYVRKRYVDIAKHSYQKALRDNGLKPKKKTDFDEAWLLLFLEEEDEVTLYNYTFELERKRQRLSEALAVSSTPLKELSKAMKMVYLQIHHYADKATAEAVIQAYRDSGVKKVMWVTEKDDRVCKVCRPRDGKIYDIDKAPQIPAHWNCRCVLKPVK